MSEYNGEVPVPDVYKAVEEMRKVQLYAYNNHGNVSLKQLYGPYKPQELTTNEFPQILNWQHYITPGSSFLGTCGSGEQAIFAGAFGATNNLFFDISYNAYWLTCLKMAALKTFKTYTEYKDFILNLLENERRVLHTPDIWRVLSYLTDVQVKYIEDMDRLGMRVITCNETCQFCSMPQAQYEELRKSAKIPVPFVWTDIRDLDKKLGQRKFDNLGYSNILSWIEPYEVGPILDQTKKHINPGGRLFLVAGETQFDDIIDVVGDFYPQPEWKIEPTPEVGLFRQIIVQHMQSTK